MPQIHVLDMYTANRIAAGEVVERPVSIVKELLENAIDAGSTSVTVEIEDGGLRYIRVTDNGCGIEPGDVLTAFERHATSKIQRAEDLERIATLGFRGEALASIAAVAQVRMTTRGSGAETGRLVEIHGGSLVRETEYGCVEGTRVEVENVFYNTPVRRNFLKKPQQEAGMVGDYIARMILAHPEMAIKYISAGKAVYHSPGDGELRTAVFCVYGTQLLPLLREVHIAEGDMRVYGYIGRSEAARPNRTHQTFIVNGRLIKSAQMSNAVQQAYDTRLMAGKFPVCILTITLPPQTMDVNIHPGKMEVRFRDEARVMDTLKRGVLASLQGTGVSAARLPKAATSWGNEKHGHAVQLPLRDEVEAQPELPHVPLPPVRLPQVELEDENFRLLEAFDDGPCKPKSTQAAAADQAETAQTNTSEIRILGQVFQTYWIAMEGETLYWIDQHAAHERLLYDKLMQGEYVFGAQQLLKPAVEQLSESECTAIKENEMLFNAMGFALQFIDALHVRIDSVPVVLGGPASLDFLHQALDALGEGNKADAQLQKRKIAQMACKAAVKAGDPLDVREIRTLLDAYRINRSLTCPHGRPVMLHMTRAQIEKMFGRIT